MKIRYQFYGLGATSLLPEMAGNMQYPAEELADMHYCYGLADGNSREAQRLYQERFPMRRAPHCQLFTRLHVRLRETGSLQVRISSLKPIFLMRLGTAKI